MKPVVESGIKLVLLWVVGYPTVAALISAVLAGPVAAVENASFSDAFLSLLAAMTLTNIPLTAWAPTGVGGIVITLLLSIFVIMVMCIFIGLSAGPLLDPFVDALGLTPGSSKQGFAKHLLVYFLGFPTFCILFAVVFGGILAAAENWPFVDGFILTLGELTLTDVALPGTPPPTTTGGKVVGLFVGVLSAAVLGIFIAVGSVPLLGFGLTFDGSFMLQRLPFLLNSEQKEELLKPMGPSKAQVAPGETTRVEPFDSVAPAAAP